MQTRFPDHYLDHWGEVYLAHPALRARGILFDTFLQDPEQLLSYVDGRPLPPLPDGEDHYPLLPEQRAVADRLAVRDEILDDEQFEQLVSDIEAELVEPLDARGSDGRLIEPLRHHAWDRNHETKRRII
jgi:hypothetical protein